MRLVAVHPEVPHHAELQANLHEDLGRLLAESGRSAEAITLRRQAVPLREQSLERCATKLGPDHPDTLKSRTGLINAYESLDRWADAERLRRDALAVRRQTAKPDSPLLADELADLGRNLLAQNKGSEAEPLLRECLAIRGQFMPDDWAHYDAMSLLGKAGVRPRLGGRAADQARLRRDEGTPSEDRHARSVPAARGGRAGGPAVRGLGQGRAGRHVEDQVGDARPARRRLQAVNGPTRGSTSRTFMLDFEFPSEAVLDGHEDAVR